MKHIVIVVDFDGTLTNRYVNLNGKNVEVPALIAVLRENFDILGSEYATEAHKLYNYYRPIEKDPNISEWEKAAKMEEWRRKHYLLLKEAGLTYDMLKKVAYDPRVVLRRWTKEFLDFAKQNGIPVVIFSSSWVGTAAIRMVLERYGIRLEDYPNLKIVSNVLRFDKRGYFVGADEPIIHGGDKSLNNLRQKLPEIDKILKDAKALVVIGDNLGDRKMAEGFNGEVLGICFAANEMRQDCAKAFEVILSQEDGNFEDVIKIIKDKLKELLDKS